MASWIVSGDSSKSRDGPQMSMEQPFASLAAPGRAQPTATQHYSPVQASLLGPLYRVQQPFIDAKQNKWGIFWSRHKPVYRHQVF